MKKTNLILVALAVLAMALVLGCAGQNNGGAASGQNGGTGTQGSSNVGGSNGNNGQLGDADISPTVGQNDSNDMLSNQQPPTDLDTSGAMSANSSRLIGDSDLGVSNTTSDADPLSSGDVPDDLSAQ